MLIEIGDKRYTFTAKMKQWKALYKQVIVLRRNAASENESEQESAEDRAMDISSAYVQEHLKAVHVRQEDGSWVADPDWHGDAEADLEPDEFLGVMSKVIVPEDNPFG